MNADRALLSEAFPLQLESFSYMKVVNSRVSFAKAAKQVPTADGRRFDTVFRHGTLQVEIYAPRGHDPQQPHTRDEAYIVVQGCGTFLCAGHREKFLPGDFLFAPAGVEHRFEDFSDDLAVWVIFYGPEGGERP
jgi:mannose-6-phosphate isomerase-like protein (cupin superfamily)